MRIIKINSIYYIFYMNLFHIIDTYTFSKTNFRKTIDILEKTMYTYKSQRKSKSNKVEKYRTM